MKYVSGRIVRGIYIWLGLERGSGRANRKWCALAFRFTSALTFYLLLLRLPLDHVQIRGPIISNLLNCTTKAIVGVSKLVSKTNQKYQVFCYIYTENNMRTYKYLGPKL